MLLVTLLKMQGQLPTSPLLIVTSCRKVWPVKPSVGAVEEGGGRVGRARRVALMHAVCPPVGTVGVDAESHILHSRIVHQLTMNQRRVDAATADLGIVLDDKDERRAPSRRMLHGAAQRIGLMKPRLAYQRHSVRQPLQRARNLERVPVCHALRDARFAIEAIKHEHGVCAREAQLASHGSE